MMHINDFILNIKQFKFCIKLGIGDWRLGIGPNPQSPIPNPQSPIPIHIIYLSLKNDLNYFNEI
jgi:hypothetical protein